MITRVIEFFAEQFKCLIGAQPFGGCLGCGKVFWSRRAWEEHLSAHRKQRAH